MDEEDDLLYREMNEEDPYYMGDSSTSHSHDTRQKHADDDHADKPGSGCLADFVYFFIGALLFVLVFVLIFS